MHPIDLLRPAPILLALCVPGVAAATDQGDDGEAPAGCPVAYEDDPFPPIRIDSTRSGFNDGGYHEYDLPVPGPIPLAILATDVDSLLIKCGTGCSPVFYGTPVNGDWGIESPSGGQLGSFLKADATQTSNLMNTMRVLYLPPADVAINGSRVIDVIAEASDRDCGVSDEGMDPDVPNARVVFKVHIERKDTGLYEVWVAAEAPQNPDFEPKPCVTDASEPADCDLMLIKQIPPPPTVSTILPAATIVGELRPLGCNPMDIDYILGECGTPPGVQPVIHNPVSRPICDAFTYHWDLNPQPGDTGFGYFLGDDSRTPFFIGVTPGPITVRVTVYDLDGEQASSQGQVVIHKPKIKRLSFDTPWDVAKDVTGSPTEVPYKAPHWEDANDDGDAADPNERRFPVAFKAKDPLKLKKIEVTVPVRPMPGDELLGEIQGVIDVGFQGHTMAYNAAGTSGQWSTDKLKWFGENFKKCRYFDPFTINWKNGVLGNTAKIDVGSTDNKLYVTMAAPGTDPGSKNHTVFELACKSNDGQDGLDALRDNIWAQFVSGPTSSPGPVLRPTPNGFNLSVVQTPLVYWLNPQAQLHEASELLEGGDGSCAAWTKLLRAAFSLQGIPAQIVTVRPKPGHAEVDNRRLYIKNWTVTNPNQWTYYWNNWYDGATAANDNGVTETTGMRGQNNDDPRSVFSNHVILQSGGKIYDPSYGGTPIPGWPDAAQIAWEDRSLFAFCRDITIVNAANVTENTPNKDLDYQ